MLQPLHKPAQLLIATFAPADLVQEFLSLLAQGGSRPVRSLAHVWRVASGAVAGTTKGEATVDQTRQRQPSLSPRIVHQGRTPAQSRLDQPLVLKQGNIFVLCSGAGDLEPNTDQGLYFHDMRYLSAETLRLGTVRPLSLLADVSLGQCGIFELSNPEIVDENDHVILRREALGVRREKKLSDAYGETITVHNYLHAPVELDVDLSFHADFQDMFAIRGTPVGQRGRLHPLRWSGSSLTFRYDGADGHQRSTILHLSEKPHEHDGGDLTYHVRLEGRGSWELAIAVEMRDEQSGSLESLPNQPHRRLQEENRRRARAGSLGEGTSVETSDTQFNEILARCFLDLHMLSMQQHGDTFFAAGVPWYVALFGRDSLATAFEMASYEPTIAEQTVRLLASRQGSQIDDWRDEQPGRILHELRVDEMANLGEIPNAVYYGSVDSTLLFLILVGTSCAWSGSLDLLHELDDPVKAALAWIDSYGDQDGDGFIDYQTRSPRGLRNQGWKDSFNAIVMEDGRLAEPPIALPEVQGYAYLAWRTIADLWDADGDHHQAARLRAKARALYVRFNKEFWRPENKYYALCRQGDGSYSQSIASNAGHALWTGIIPRTRARAVVKRLLQADMFSGWGIRTLSSEDVSYNPLDYQVGSVWPHDNAFIALGLYRLGFSQAGGAVFTALRDAAARFRDQRLPEVFAGFDRSYAPSPVHFPVACNPQAWASGSIPLLLQAALGIEPDGLRRHLVIRRPALPEWLDWVQVRNLRIAGGSLDLRYQRSGQQTYVAVTRSQGGVDVVVQG